MQAANARASSQEQSNKNFHRERMREEVEESAPVLFQTDNWNPINDGRALRMELASEPER